LLRYIVSKEGEDWGYGFDAQGLTEFLNLAPRDVVYNVKTVDSSKITDPRRFETYPSTESWDEHR
jgi:hypothetical protein